MNTGPWLILDVHYLAHRAFHTGQELTWKGQATGVIFGLLKAISTFKDQFDTDRVAFCFEHKHLFRRDIFPAYKEHRRGKMSDEDKHNYTQLGIQIHALRGNYLPTIGFRNIFCVHGMESDDLMAAIACGLPETEEAILITSDMDLLQCLRSNVTIYSPQKQKLFTEHWFKKEYGLRPSQWAVVKAMAGCHGDGVPGIGGIGEKTALAYLRGELKKGKAFEKIKSEEAKITIQRNRRLVQLPYEGCPFPVLVPDKISKQGWEEVCTMLGMKSIAGRPPVASRRSFRI